MKIFNNGNTKNHLARQKSTLQYDDVYNSILDSNNFDDEQTRQLQEALKAKSSKKFQSDSTEVNPIGGAEDGIATRAYGQVKKIANQGIATLGKAGIVGTETMGTAKDKIAGIEQREQNWKKQQLREDPEKTTVDNEIPFEIEHKLEQGLTISEQELGTLFKSKDKTAADVWNIAGGATEIGAYVAGGAYMGMGKGATILARTMGTIGRGAIADTVIATTIHGGSEEAKSQVAKEVGFGIVGGIIGQVGGDKLLTHFYKKKGMSDEQITEALTVAKEIGSLQKQTDKVSDVELRKEVKQVIEEEKLTTNPIKAKEIEDEVVEEVKQKGVEELLEAIKVMEKEEVEEVKQLAKIEEVEEIKEVAKIKEVEEIKEVKQLAKEEDELLENPREFDYDSDPLTHTRLEEFLNMRRETEYKNTLYANKINTKGVLDENGNYHNPTYERNYNADFAITKQDVKNIEKGNISEGLREKLTEDLMALDGNPDYAPLSKSEVSDIDTLLEKVNVKVVGDDLVDENGQILFANGANFIGTAIAGGAIGGISGLADEMFYNKDLSLEDYLTRIGIGMATGGAIGKYGRYQQNKKSHISGAFGGSNPSPKPKPKDNDIGAFRAGLGALLKPIKTVAQVTKLVDVPFEYVAKAFRKSDEIISKYSTKPLTNLKIKGVSFDDFIRKIGADEHGFKSLDRVHKEKILKEYYKYKSNLQKGDTKAINLSKKTRLADGKSNEASQELTIKYLENPKVREVVRESNPELAGELDEIVNSITLMGEQKVKQGLMAQGQFDKWGGKYLTRLYTGDDAPKSIEITRGLKGYKEGKGRKIPSIIDYIEYLRKEKPNSELLKSVITDPEMLVKTTIARGQANLAIDKLYRSLIDDPNIIDQNLLVQVPKMKGLDLPTISSPYYAKARLFDIVKDKEWEKVVNEKIAEIEAVGDNIGKNVLLDEKSNGRYGVFSGLPVNVDIANLIRGTQRIFEDPLTTANSWDKAFSATLAYFKWAKVPANVFSYPRNFMGNTFNWTMSGANPIAMPRMILEAFEEVANKGKWYRIAEEEGLLQQNLASTEVNAILSELRENITATTKTAKAKKMTLSMMEKVGDMYGSIDDFWKIARVKYGVEQEGLTPAQALRKAHDTHFDYSLTYDIIKSMRDPNIKNGALIKMLGSMFPTFTQKAFALSYKTLREKPLTATAMLGAGYGIGQILEEKKRVDLGDKYEAYKYFDPKFLNKYGVLSYVDKDQNLIYIDTGYVIPFGQMMDLGDAVSKMGSDPQRAFNHLQDGIKNLGLGGNPIYALKDLMNNKNSFTGKAIYYPYNSAETMKGVGEFFFQLLAPGTLVNIKKYSDYRHPIPMRILTGANVYRYTVEENIRNARWRDTNFMKMLQAVGTFSSSDKATASRLVDKYNNKEITKEQFNKKIDVIMERLKFFIEEKDKAGIKKDEYIDMAEKAGHPTTMQKSKPATLQVTKKWSKESNDFNMNDEFGVTLFNSSRKLFKEDEALRYLESANSKDSKLFITNQKKELIKAVKARQSREYDPDNYKKGQKGADTASRRNQKEIKKLEDRFKNLGSKK